MCQEAVLGQFFRGASPHFWVSRKDLLEHMGLSLIIHSLTLLGLCMLFGKIVAERRGKKVPKVINVLIFLILSVALVLIFWGLSMTRI